METKFVGQKGLKVLVDNIKTKVDKVEGKQLSTNDFTNALKTKLDGIPADAMSSVDVNNRFKELINAAPEALDTLGEIADKLNDNDDVVAAITNTVASNKTDIEGKLNTAKSELEAKIEEVIGGEEGTSLSSLSKDISDLNTALSTHEVTAASTYVAKVEGKDLSDNNYDDASKAKLDGIIEFTEADIIALFN